MKIFPAIDLLSGQVVRLKEGDYDAVTVYGQDPVAVARAFKEKGAKYLHVVDLDGARHGTQQNFSAIEAIVKEGGLFVEVGGGARDEDSVMRYLDLGIDRVIAGTMAVKNPSLLEKLAARYPGKIAAGVDAKGGFVAIHGWREVTRLRALDFIRRLPEKNVNTVIYTDIARDGMLMGANLGAYRALSGIANLNVIASGGVSSEADVVALCELNLDGAIIGKALYDGHLTLERALALAKGARP